MNRCRFIQRLSSLVKKYQTLLRNWESLKLFPEKQAYKGNARKVPVLIQLIITNICHYSPSFSDPDRHAYHLLYLVSSIILSNTWSYLKKQKARCSGRKTFHFPNPLKMSCEDEKLCGSQQRRNFQETFY